MKVIKESLSIDEEILSKFENLPTKIRIITRDLFDKEEKKKNKSLVEQLNEADKEELNEDINVKAYSKSDKYAHYIEMYPNPAEVFELTKFGKTAGYIKANVPINRQPPREGPKNQTLEKRNALTTCILTKNKARFIKLRNGSGKGRKLPKMFFDTEI